MPWVSFGHNRTQAISLAKGKADYHLVIDADMTVNVRGDFGVRLDPNRQRIKPSSLCPSPPSEGGEGVHGRLTADAYLIRFEGDFEYYLPLLVSDRHEWRHIGVTHEHIHSDTAKVREKLPELTVTHHCDGHNRADKFQRDVNLLTKALETDPENARNMFYLAQSYRDLGLGYQAIEWYAKRVARGGWDEESWYARYQIARLKHQSALPWPQVLHAYLDAWQHRPSRLEPLLPVARHYREAKQYHLGLMFSRAAVETPYPDEVLFIERNVYEWELPLEYAICCYWLGLHEEAIRVNDEILARRNTPKGFRETAERNRRFSVEAVRTRNAERGIEEEHGTQIDPATRPSRRR